MTHHFATPILPMLVLAALLALLTPRLVLAAESPAGSVKSVSGQAVVWRGGAAHTLKPGERIFEHDVFVTGKTGSLGLVLRDNTTLALGPSSRLEVTEFLFAPKKNELAQTLRLSRGSMAMVSGETAKFNPDAAKMETPLCAIGIPGAHFRLWASPGGETQAEAAQTVPAVTGREAAE